MEYHYKPYTTNQSAWTAHFKAMSEGRMSAHQVYRLKDKHTKPKEEKKVEIVAPSQQVVEQAESELHDEEMPQRAEASYRPEVARKPKGRGGKSNYGLKRRYAGDIFH